MLYWKPRKSAPKAGIGVRLTSKVRTSFILAIIGSHFSCCIQAPTLLSLYRIKLHSRFLSHPSPIQHMGERKKSHWNLPYPNLPPKGSVEATKSNWRCVSTYPSLPPAL